MGETLRLGMMSPRRLATLEIPKRVTQVVQGHRTWVFVRLVNARVWMERGELVSVRSFQKAKNVTISMMIATDKSTIVRDVKSAHKIKTVLLSVHLVVLACVFCCAKMTVFVSIRNDVFRDFVNLVSMEDAARPKKYVTAKMTTVTVLWITDLRHVLATTVPRVRLVLGVARPVHKRAKEAFGEHVQTK